ncbi:hypothetical protein [Aliarcobacter cibarius]|uniref:DUF4845 domain-containing protein n=1 Tax=Aliarcobacter cibarius TaxID=255507 RepID=A0ABY2V677_9BACT|nr:hypothetical protein [Aliarcobacter cibarius]QEZ89949.1 hypothetical protein ACIB15232_1865 [Aliarcobacter cibarius]TLT01238.1 hypothetical protein FE247_01800 [Aliarcobacter cibarius]TLT01643.1 hypothetical protein FE245_01800 [Aliarcobacter cibarius]
MPLDLLIPFGILLILVVYLIYSRTKFEKSIVKLYEEKFEDWKKHTPISTQTVIHKELVGLVFKEDYKLTVELFDKSVEDRLKRTKFDTKFIGKEDE